MISTLGLYFVARVEDGEVAELVEGPFLTFDNADSMKNYFPDPHVAYYAVVKAEFSIDSLNIL